MKIINGQRIHDVTLTESQLAIIQEGLFLVPYGRAAPVVAAIARQLEPPQETAPTPASAIPAKTEAKTVDLVDPDTGATLKDVPVANGANAPITIT